MLSDRPYMRRSFPQAGNASMVIKLIIANIAVFLMQNVFVYALKSSIIEQFFASSPYAISKGYIWTLITYSFLHANFIHILINMLVLYFIGTHVESALGPRRFLGLYLTSALAGGLCWLLFHLNTPGLVVGASAATIGSLICFCALMPNQPITFLLFFIIPVTMKPKWIAAIVVGFELFGFLFRELQGQGASDIAYSAHLGGALGSYLFFLIVVQRGFSLSSLIPRSIKIEKPNRGKKRGLGSRFKVNIAGQKDTKEKVNRILDKINNKGFASLTQDEKDFLERAKDFLKK